MKATAVAADAFGTQAMGTHDRAYSRYVQQTPKAHKGQKKG
jgi:hypothetical protein